MEFLYGEKESGHNFLCLSHTQNESVYMGGIYNLVLFLLHCSSLTPTQP